MNTSIFPLVVFKDFQCKVRPVLYPDGNSGLVLEDAIDGSPIATATVNLPVQMMKIVDHLADAEPRLKDKLPEVVRANPRLYVFIKDYSENEGMLNLLQEENIVDHPLYISRDNPYITYASSGYIEQVPFMYICHPNLIQAFNQLHADWDQHKEAFDKEAFENIYTKGGVF